LLAALGPYSGAPIAIAAALHAVSIILILCTGWRTPMLVRGKSLTLSDFIRHSLPLATAVLFFSMFDSTVLSLLPVYGLKIGLITRLAILMVTVVLLGDACLQVPLGWAADRFGRRRVHAVCAVMTGVTALALPLGTVTTAAMWPCLFLMGGAAGALYTLAIVRIGDGFSGAQLISANAFVGLLWGVGSLTGPLLGSLSMTALKPQGLMLFVAAGAFVCLLSMFYDTGRT
jgi:MFS family permease